MNEQLRFQDFPYERPDFEAFVVETNGVIANLASAEDYTAFHQSFIDFNALMCKISTTSTISSIRHSIDTRDAFYEKENDFWDEVGPLLQELETKAVKVVLASKFCDELKKDVPLPFFMKAENALRCFDERIIPLLQEENKLSSAYEKLIAGAQIEFEGEVRTLAGMGSFMVDKDEQIRRDAYKAYWAYMEEKEAELDDIYDKLVHLRDKIAKELGFANFVELGYLRMNRLDYNQEMVETYRKQVLTDVVPVANKLYAAQMKRLGVDKLEVFNNDYCFVSGNPTPKYDKDEMVKRAQVMYREMSPETGEFFDFMVERGLLDLEAKPGKRAGGYCTFMENYKAPFIFSNFNGTSGDVDVLTHEAGHAFQCFRSRDIVPADCVFPTNESAEIHSMSMEFIAWPWMKSFFEEDTEKYYYTHLGDAVRFLPYGVCVDHFQHEVYNNVNMTPDERKATWRRLEKMYLPHKDYSSIPHLDKGTWWQKQLHIFGMPFYYIDYTLAQVCALQFWFRLQNQDEKAFGDYLNICNIGGSKTFTQIVAAANLKSPFEEGCMSDMMKEVDAFLSASPAAMME